MSRNRELEAHMGQSTYKNTGAAVAALIVQETVFVTSSNFLGEAGCPINFDQLSFQRGQFPLLHHQHRIHAVGSCSACTPRTTLVLRHIKQQLDGVKPAAGSI